jgi:hypothetical protein
MALEWRHSSGDAAFAWGGFAGLHPSPQERSHGLPQPMSGRCPFLAIGVRNRISPHERRRAARHRAGLRSKVGLSGVAEWLWFLI